MKHLFAVLCATFVLAAAQYRPVTPATLASGLAQIGCHVGWLMAPHLEQAIAYCRHSSTRCSGG